MAFKIEPGGGEAIGLDCITLCEGSKRSRSRKQGGEDGFAGDGHVFETVGFELKRIVIQGLEGLLAAISGRLSSVLAAAEAELPSRKHTQYRQSSWSNGPRSSR
ncbi:MAG: hypothetical protein R3D84_15655 [Paracoccaceae bacterium]